MPNTSIAPTPAAPLPAVPMPAAPIRVAVVEDDAACRASLVSALNDAEDMHLVWAVATRSDALEAVRSKDFKSPDVLLVDLGLPDGSGLDVIAAARARWPNVASMVSTIFGDEANVLRAIEAGALGYLLKDVPAQGVVDEVRHLHAGGSPISPMVARKLLVQRHTPVDAVAELDSVLSSRETEVLRLVSRGHTLDEVAQSLGVSRHTVRSFVRRLYAKLQVKTRAEAVHEGVRQGLLDGPA
ncbi:response regulator transcription factor [Ottowia thiooxydans]|uniref:response regulator transcription factor n=1 Tax=Ottowia thiooxydans TaxID=219182 RepID=UPI001FDF4109|nr:response regulator transcription factor [Ottowia thiooxydans]